MNPIARSLMAKLDKEMDERLKCTGERKVRRKIIPKMGDQRSYVEFLKDQSEEK